MRRRADARARFGVALATACIFWLPGATPAEAQIAGVLTIESEARNRAYAVSNGDPALTAALAYDHASGAYANVAATATIAAGEPRIVAGQANVGYAWRLDPEVSLDVGVVRNQYTHYSSTERSTGNTEGYFGVAARGLAARLSFSPDYFRGGTPTLYAEADDVVALGGDWNLAAHLGSLIYLGSRPGFASGTNYDWRLGITRRWSALDIHASLSGGGPRSDFYGGARRHRTALVVGASIAF